MASRNLKIESLNFDDSGTGSQMLIVFNRNLNPFEQDGLQSRIERLVAESNRKGR